jgi:site-specific DNA recombinase
MPTTTTETDTNIPIAQATKRAFSYLRVSSDGQVKTDYSEDGLSIDAQRQGAGDKALSLDAEIVGEFSDPGRSAFVDLHKRTGFLAMLDELKERNRHVSTRVDYVIVWALSRWARNTIDHWQTRQIIREAGARLISITEPMAGEDSAAAFLYESMIATHNQFQSMQTSENVKRGLKQKASVGGTYGPARFGYLNDVDILPDGRRVPVVVIDPDRGPYMTLAFQLYDSGEYSIAQLVDELDYLRVRSRPTKRWPATKIGTSVLQRMLRNPYYVGKIVYKRGTPDEQVFDGRHDPLIDQDTFDRVQARLDEKRVAGERPQTHQHYLRGSLYCDECGERLVYGISTGRSGKKYPYYFCMGRIKRNGCEQRANIRPELIETAIQRHYAHVELRYREVGNRKTAIRAMVEVSQEALIQVQQAKARLIRSLEARQDDLLEMRFTEKSISPALFKRKQDKLQTELDAAHESLAKSEQRLTIEAARLYEALELAGDVQAVYREAAEQIKRGYNQAFFVKLFVRAEWDMDDGQTDVQIMRAALTPPYAALLAEGFAEAVLSEAEAIRDQAHADTEGAPKGRSGSPKPLVAAGVSNYELMAERGGFEPPNEVSPVTRFPVAPVQPLRHLSGHCDALEPPMAFSRRVAMGAPSGSHRLRHRWVGALLGYRSCCLPPRPSPRT